MDLEQRKLLKKYNFAKVIDVKNDEIFINSSNDNSSIFRYIKSNRDKERYNEIMEKIIIPLEDILNDMDLKDESYKQEFYK